MFARMWCVMREETEAPENTALLITFFINRIFQSARRVPTADFTTGQAAARGTHPFGFVGPASQPANETNFNW